MILKSLRTMYFLNSIFKNRLWFSLTNLHLVFCFLLFHFFLIQFIYVSGPYIPLLNMAQFPPYSRKNFFLTFVPKLNHTASTGIFITSKIFESSWYNPNLGMRRLIIVFLQKFIISENYHSKKISNYRYFMENNMK